MDDYNKVRGLTKDEFDRAITPKDPLVLPPKYNVTGKEDLARLERLLDVKPGTFDGAVYEFQDYTCPVCGRQLSTYDFALTGIVDGGHSKSFILHTLVGSKYVVNPPRRTRCSNCDTISPYAHSYRMSDATGGYSCSVG